MTDNQYIDALNQIVIILESIHGGTPRNEVFYEIGRASMTAKLALGSKMSEHAQHVTDSRLERLR